ncbi:hypothetical protein ACRRRV_16170, partial [Methylococcus sp. S1B]
GGFLGDEQSVFVWLLHYDGSGFSMSEETVGIPKSGPELDIACGVVEISFDRFDLAFMIENLSIFHFQLDFRGCLVGGGS